MRLITLVIFAVLMILKKIHENLVAVFVCATIIYYLIVGWLEMGKITISKKCAEIVKMISNISFTDYKIL